MENKNEQDLALVNAEDLSLVSENSLNEKQLQQILRRTPEKYKKKRPAKGGGEWTYVTGGYIKKCLNIMFGWDWDFEILDEKIMYGEAIVKGRLTCRSNGKTIIKTQFGNKDIVYRKQTSAEITEKSERIPLSVGNDLKAAATDCLKKCASEIGIAADVYNADEFKEVNVAQIDSEEPLGVHPEIQESLDLITDIDGLEKYILQVTTADKKLNSNWAFRGAIEKKRKELMPKTN